MLTNEFYVRGKFWEKDPHTHSPPPLSVVGVSNKESSDNSIKEDLEDISNESKEVCVDIGKKEDHEDISNEGK
jgi:hypothetical protein